MDMTTVFEAAISLFVAVMTAVIIPLAVKRFGAERVERLAYWVRVAVSAAEQIFSQTENAGADKKSYVKAFVSHLGFDGESSETDALIESEVLTINEKEEARV